MDEAIRARIGREGALLLLERADSAPAPAGREVLWALKVELRLDGLAARTHVWLGPEGAEPSLVELFDDLAANWRGWTGRKDWEGTEGGLMLSCSHDGVGTVGIAVHLSHLSGAGWSAKGVIAVDAGQLDQVASDVRSVFFRALVATALTTLVIAPASDAALCIRIATLATRPIVGDMTIIEVKTFVPFRNGLKPGIVRSYPFRVETVSPRGRAFRVIVKPSRNPYAWRGSFRFPSAGVWTVSVTNWGSSYPKGCGEQLHVRVRAS